MKRHSSVLAILAMVMSVGIGPPTRAIADTVYNPTLLTGDFNGDGKTDLALIGVAGWTSIPVAFSHGDGGFTVTSLPTPEFPGWAAAPGVKVVTGDFNGDGRTDIALTGRPGWTTIPVAYSNGDGTFAVTNSHYPEWAGLAAHGAAKLVTGDFNGDGKTDLALTGPAEWDSVPLAFSGGNGYFWTVAFSTPLFPALSSHPKAKLVTGDFNGDGRTDLALTGPPEWDSVPVAFSNGVGQFNSTALSTPLFPALSPHLASRLLTGDFNGDDKTDLALTRVGAWDSIPVAFSTGGGQFNSTALSTPTWPALAAHGDNKFVTGDFNDDGRTDLALAGRSDLTSIPVAFSNGFGGFTTTTALTSQFPGLAANPRAKMVSGDFNGDGKTDIALTGVPGWTSIPVAFSAGDGTFNVTTTFTSSFPRWASGPGPVNEPGTRELEAAAKSVTVRWVDLSDNENWFVVQKRDRYDAWVDVHTAPSRNTPGGGWGNEEYSWTDTDTTMSAQCYRIVARNVHGSNYEGVSRERCTVRPDPDRFPVEVITTQGEQWSGFPTVEWQRGAIRTSDRVEPKALGTGDQPLGVDLGWWTGWPDNWTFFGSGGSGGRIMMGQALAIRHVGGQYLKHGSQTFGVNLEWSPTPAYEWYIIGNEGDGSGASHAGESPGSGDHALWNSSSRQYLVHGDRAFGVSLRWYDPTEVEPPPPPPPPPPAGVKTINLYNCSWPDHRPVAMWVLDTTAGTPWTQVGGSLAPQWSSSGSCGPNTAVGQPWTFSPVNGHNYWIRAIDYDRPGCSNQPDNGCWRLEIRNLPGGANGVIRHDIIS